MCGIFALLNHIGVYNNDIIEREFLKGQKRGPETSKLDITLNKNAVLGFHRLAINGLNTLSNQPFYINDVILICNGEIYNYKELYNKMAITPKTNSDCEVIIHLYEKYGIEQTLQMLDGVFGFILFDTKNNTIFVARDPIGVRPIYGLFGTELFGFASELKCLSYFHQMEEKTTIEQFTPGSY